METLEKNRINKNEAERRAYARERGNESTINQGVPDNLHINGMRSGMKVVIYSEVSFDVEKKPNNAQSYLTFSRLRVLEVR